VTDTNHTKRRGYPAAAAYVMLLAGAVSGSVLTSAWLHPEARAQAPGADAELAALRADVARLKEVVHDQSHAMADVGYHFSNLWFAGRRGNWPLADFYASETKAHLRWAVRIIPVRKDAQGRDVDLRAILEAVEGSSLKGLEDAVKGRDPARFEAAYRTMAESCVACHQASGKPFIRPHVPEQPDTHVLDFEPEPAR